MPGYCLLTTLSSAFFSSGVTVDVGAGSKPASTSLADAASTAEGSMLDVSAGASG